MFCFLVDNVTRKEREFSIYKAYAFFLVSASFLWNFVVQNFLDWKCSLQNNMFCSPTESESRKPSYTFRLKFIRKFFCNILKYDHSYCLIIVKYCKTKKNISENGCSSSQRSDPLWSLHGFQLRGWSSGWWRRHCCPGEDHKVHCSEHDVMTSWWWSWWSWWWWWWWSDFLFFTSSKVPEEETTQAPANVKQENVKNRFK